LPFVLIREALRFALLFFQPAVAVRAENLVLRRQLAHFLERGQRPRRSTDAERISIALTCRLFDWRSAVAIVTPATVIRWPRELGRAFWRRKSLRGRPPLPGNIRELIVRMDRENPSWGEQRIADELLIKLGVRVSARTVAKYLRCSPSGDRPRRDQRWSMFLRNHARAIVACDFAVSMTLAFEIVYIFVAMEVGSRRILHVNTTRHPTAEWTAQQLRSAVDPERHRFLLHDRDAIFSSSLDEGFESLGVTVLKSPPRSPKANAFCERLTGTLRRECLDWIIPLSDNHLRAVVREWAAHYNRGRPHTALGPGVPENPPGLPAPLALHRHELPSDACVVSTSILGGLHHDYRLAA
jgi:putative transposase